MTMGVAGYAGILLISGTLSSSMIQSLKIIRFLAVAEHLNLTAAAAKLNISQPALSRSISQLEERLGVPLLERLPTGVVLTRYGEILARRARLMQLDAEHTLSEIDALKTGSGGKLRIGAGPLWARVYLPAAVAALQNQHSGFQVEITSGVIDTLVPAILGNQIDIFCSSLDFPNHPELEKVHLLNVSHVVVARKGHPLTRKSHVEARDLLDFPWITMKADYVYRNRLGSFFVSQNLKPPRSSIVVGPGIHSLHILRHANYLTTIPTAMLSSAANLGIEKLNMSESFWDSPAGVVCRKSNFPLPVISSLISILRTEVGKESQQPGS